MKKYYIEFSARNEEEQQYSDSFIIFKAGEGKEQSVTIIANIFDARMAIVMCEALNKAHFQEDDKLPF